MNQELTKASQEYINSQIDYMRDLSANAFSMFSKIAELNTQQLQSVLWDSVDTTKQAIQARDSSDASSAIASSTINPVERSRAFQYRLSQILADAQKDAAATTESHAPKTMKAAEALAECTKQNAEQAGELISQRTQQLAENVKTTVVKSFVNPNDGAPHQQSSQHSNQGKQSRQESNRPTSDA